MRPAFTTLFRCQLTVATLIGGLIAADGCSPARNGNDSSVRTDTSVRNDTRPNVLFILLDDAGYGDVGYHGNPDVQTPTIDRLAEQSAQLTNFYAQPVCTPSRACLMTGRDALRTRAVTTLYRDMMDPAEVTMAQVFHNAGYHTAIFGKWHLGDNYPMRTIDKGFEEALTMCGGGMAHWFDRPGSSYFNPVLEHNGRSERHNGYCNDIWFREASHYIAHHRNQPFFCYLATNLPHDPLIAPLDLWLPFHERGINEENAIVYGMMKNVDDNLKQLLKQLDDEGLTQNTIIVLSSDNGPAMQLSEHVPRYNGHLRGEKKQVYEGGIREPFIIRWPGHLEPGRKIDRIASLIDMMPTLTEACGVPGPKNVKLDGVSLWPLLTGAVAPENWPDRALFFQWSGMDTPTAYHNAGVRNQHWKLVDGKELYDEAGDEAEAHDVAAANPEVVADLRQRYDAWFKDVCSNGFDYPRIQIGTPYENPTVLNRRDWEMETAPNQQTTGHWWETAGNKELMGHWVVQVMNAGRYQVTVELKDTQHAPGEVYFQFGDINAVQQVQNASAVSVTTPARNWPARLLVRLPPIDLPARPDNLKVWYAAPDGPPQGVAEVRVQRQGIPITDPNTSSLTPIASGDHEVLIDDPQAQPD